MTSNCWMCYRHVTSSSYTDCHLTLTERFFHLWVFWSNQKADMNKSLITFSQYKCTSERNLKGEAARRRARAQRPDPNPLQRQRQRSLTVTSEERPVFTVTAADRSTSPPAPRPHTTVVHTRDAISLLEMKPAEVPILVRLPQDMTVPTDFYCRFGSGLGLKYKYCQHQMLLLSINTFTFNIKITNDE